MTKSKGEKGKGTWRRILVIEVKTLIV